MEPEVLPTLQEQVHLLQQQNLELHASLHQMSVQLNTLLAQHQAPVDPAIQQAVEDENAENKKIFKLLKMNLPKFTGSSNRDPEDWLYEVKGAFDIAQINEEITKLKAIKQLLDEKVSRWWRSLSEGEGVETPTEFNQFEKALISRYRTHNPEHVARQKLESFKQKGSADSYADGFTTLALAAKLNEKEKQFKFIEGLKPRVHKKVSIEYELDKLKTFKEVVDYAVAVDNALFKNDNRSDRKTGSYKGQQRNGQSNSSSHPPASTASGSAPMDVDAYTKIPKLTPETRAQCITEGRCLRCRELGHIALNCPNRKPGFPNGRRQIGCAEARAMFDSGSSVNLVSGRFVLDNDLKTREIRNGPLFRTADGRYHRCEKILDTARIRASCYSDTLTNVFVLPGNCPFHLILGKPWFDEKNPDIDWPNNLITLQHKGESIAFRADYYDQKILRDEGIIYALEISKELDDGNIASMCVLKPLPEDYQNYEIGDNGEKLDSNGLEKYVDMLLEDYVEIFDREEPELVDRDIEHEIELEPGSNPVAQQMYRLTFEELAELKKQILHYLEKGFIRPSKSPYGAPILFVRKKNGAMRMCVDYRGLNRITKKNRCPLPRIEELLDKLSGAKYFTSLDLDSAFHHIKIAEKDIEKTAFRTPFGHFEFVVLPFGLCNAPATFQTLMNTIFRDELYQFVLCYLDDIMIFSKTSADHNKHVRHVCEKLKQHKLSVNKKKCLFFQTKIAWLGYVISENGIEVDQNKISTILEWPIPKNTTDILSFLGFTGYYRKFIEKYSHIALPLTELLKKNISFFWTAKQQQAFETLKQKLTTAPVLILPSPDFPFELYTDASDFAYGGVLMQDQGRGLQPVAFSSRKLSEAERKYTIYDKEALSQIHHLKLWRCYIQSAHRSTAYTDNNVLRHLQTQKTLSPRQARWVEILSQYNVYVDYVAGKANVIADALSRRPDLAMSVVFVCQDSDWLFQLKESYSTSAEAQKIVKMIQDGSSRDYSFDQGYIVRRKPTSTQLYIPDTGSMRQDLLAEHHDSLLAGHFGVRKTAALLSRCYCWPQMQRDIRHFVQSCQRCAESKSSNQKKPGLLQPLPTPTRRFEVITMDFVTSLPEVEGFNAIMIMVDKLTKRVFLAPTTNSVTAEDAATLFYSHVVRIQGIPAVIISDRGTQFTSIFWKSMVAQLGIKHKLSTAYHPQTDGQSEITVRIVVDLLRTLHFDHPNWVQILPAVEFAINNSTNVSTGKTPFFMCYGEEVPTPPTLNLKALAKQNPNQPSVDFAARTQLIIQEAQRSLGKAQQQQKYYADKGRRHLTFEVGDQVYISTADLPLKGPRKLAPKWFGPVPVTRKLSEVSYKVALPPLWRRRHPVFHVEKLKPFVPGAETSSNTTTRPPPDLEQGPDVFNVEKILDRRSTPWGRGFHVEYYIKWEGYPLCDSTSEPKSNLRDAGTGVQQMMREIDQQHGVT